MPNLEMARNVGFRTREQVAADRIDCELCAIILRAEALSIEEVSSVAAWREALHYLRAARAKVRLLMHRIDRDESSHA